MEKVLSKLMLNENNKVESVTNKIGASGSGTKSNAHVCFTEATKTATDKSPTVAKQEEVKILKSNTLR